MSLTPVAKALPIPAVWLCSAKLRQRFDFGATKLAVIRICVFGFVLPDLWLVVSVKFPFLLNPQSLCVDASHH
jgi:hypothetical protein